MHLLRGIEGNGLLRNWFSNLLFGISTSIGVYLSLWNNAVRLADQKNLFGNNQTENFDFIIVGGGSAGALVANRLSEKYTVLLLEAGGDPHILQYIPAFMAFLVNNPEIDWIHTTTPQKYSSLALNHQQSVWNQGKALGGTSNINYFIQSRGNPMDYAAWANISEDDSWNYENVLPFFKKHEDFVGQWSSGDVHGTGGEMRIEVPPYTGMAEYFIKAGVELGYIQDDLNGRYTEGFDYVHSPLKNGARQSTYKAFLKPILNRPNLSIRRFSHVNKIYLKEDTNEAYAVEYDRYGVRRFAYASKEIILSAGAIKSPQILMVSGIGPKDQLEQLGIPVKKDLPVGKNLQDHLCTYLGPFIVDAPVSFMPDRHLTVMTMLEYLTQGTGPFTNIQTNAQAFIATPSEKAKSLGNIWPNIQYYFVGMGNDRRFPDAMSHAFNLKSDVAKKYYALDSGTDGFTIFVSNARPQARGEITLISSDPYSPPRIEPNYLDNPNDMQVTLEGVYKALELVENTTIFKSIGGRFTKSVFPGCEQVPFRSEEYFKCFIRQYSVSLHHITGTCSMGKRDSPNAVVDSELKVIGINNLRVIDASVIPKVTVGNTNSPTIMVAEKGADLILKYWSSLFETTGLK